MSDSLKYKIFDLLYRRETEEKKIDLETILTCPSCKNSVILDRDVICNSCKRRYPIKDGIIYLRVNDGKALK